jgi:hypothetical protein
MTSFTTICPYCGTLCDVPGSSNGRVYLYYHCPFCSCLFNTVVAALREDLHSPDEIYATVCLKEGMLNKRGK